MQRLFPMILCHAWGCLLALACLMGGAHAAVAQVQPGDFVSPFDFPLLLSGNFAELRGDHFHAGIDIKTGGVEGKTVRSIGDGYVSRVRVTVGSGKVLHVVHPNGYTSVYRHLSSFNPEMDRRISALQYQRGEWEVELSLKPDEWTVRKGMPIAKSGNTGFSYAPHLHLELVETKSGDRVDPAEFLGHLLVDSKAPRLHGVMLFPMLGEGVVNGQSTPQQVALTAPARCTAWGKIGVGVKANDYMDGTSNVYGVKHIVLLVDGKEVMRSVTSRFSEAEDALIYYWVYRGYVRSYLNPYAPMRLLQPADRRGGLVEINEERDYHFEYRLSDAFGNETRTTFVVHGQPTPLPANLQEHALYLPVNRTRQWQYNGMTLHVRAGSLFENSLPDFELLPPAATLSDCYQLSSVPVSMRKTAHLSFKMQPQWNVSEEKLYIVAVNRGKKDAYVPSAVRAGCLEAEIKTLRTYAVAADTLPPMIVRDEKTSAAKHHKLRFKVNEKETRLKSCILTIDGKQVPLARPNAMQLWRVCYLDDRYISRGVKHQFELTATDVCGNSSVCKGSFSW